MKYFDNILSNLRNWKESKVNKQPLSPENAYSLSSVGKVKTMNEILAQYRKHVLKEIKDIASFGHTYIMIEFPDYLCAEHKMNVRAGLEELGYKILFYNTDILVISWKVE